MRLLTPAGTAGVAVVAVSPAQRLAVWSCLATRSGRRLPDELSRTPRLASLVLDGAVVDEVLVVDRGSRGLELHLHGAPAVLAALLTKFSLGPTGVDAEPAEHLLRVALCPEQLELALEQLRHPFPSFLASLGVMPAAARRQAVAAAMRRSAVGMAHVAPARVVLVGAQNAGKSTLFNRLLFRERVLTGPMPGLTRDPVAEVTTLCGYPYELVDTAGEGPAAAAVDVAAIAAGRSRRVGAMALLVVDQSRGPTDIDRQLVGPGTLVLANKTDLSGPAWPGEFVCHARLSSTTTDSAAVRRMVGELLRQARALPTAGPVGGPAALDQQQLDCLLAFGQP